MSEQQPNKRQLIQFKYNNLSVLLNLVIREHNELGALLNDLRELTTTDEQKE